MGVLERLRRELKGTGLECHPFKMGWYNARVSTHFRFPYPEDTFAVVIVSSPSMFEKLFLPYLTSHYQPGQLDPLDQCLKDYFTHLQGLFTDYHVEAIQDYELHATRRPKVLVQTAGHVAGAAYYYQRSDVSPDPWPEAQKIFGVSVHPRYGGWFALRGVLIFRELLASDLMLGEPVDCVSSREKRIELLESFNFHWRDWTYRDVTETGVEEQYSEEQCRYFATEPCKRFELIAQKKKGM